MCLYANSEITKKLLEKKNQLNRIRVYKTLIWEENDELCSQLFNHTWKVGWNNINLTDAKGYKERTIIAINQPFSDVSIENGIHVFRTREEARTDMKKRQKKINKYIKESNGGGINGKQLQGYYFSRCFWVWENNKSRTITRTS